MDGRGAGTTPGMLESTASSSNVCLGSARSFLHLVGRWCLRHLCLQLKSSGGPERAGPEPCSAGPGPPERALPQRHPPLKSEHCGADLRQLYCPNIATTRVATIDITSRVAQRLEWGKAVRGGIPEGKRRRRSRSGHFGGAEVAQSEHQLRIARRWFRQDTLAAPFSPRGVSVGDC